MSSPLILSLSTVFALIGIVLVAIAFGTNNWTEYTVDRVMINQIFERNSSARTEMTSQRWSQALTSFDRTYGLFRICYPTDIPHDKREQIYTSPLGAQCENRARDYQIPEDKNVVDGYTEHEVTRMHLLRTCVAFYIVGLFLLFLCLFTGITGCWRRSHALILSTGILLLFATLFLAAAMAVWHGVDYLERELIDKLPYYRAWHWTLIETTAMTYGWSYRVSWIGIGFVLISSILMLAAYRAMKEEEREEYEKKRAPYMMPNYYDKAMMPYATQAAAGYPQQYPYNYPAAAAAYYGGYGTYGGGAGNGYYGYLTYGR